MTKFEKQQKKINYMYKCFGSASMGVFITKGFSRKNISKNIKFKGFKQVIDLPF